MMFFRLFQLTERALRDVFCALALANFAGILACSSPDGTQGMDGTLKSDGADTAGSAGAGATAGASDDASVGGAGGTATCGNAGVGGTGGTATGGAAGDVCEPQKACKVNLATGTVEPHEELVGVCSRQKYPDAFSGGLYSVCLVAPDGTLYVTITTGSREIFGDCWSHSGWGGGTTFSTLSAADEQRCADAKLLAVEIARDGGLMCVL